MQADEAELMTLDSAANILLVRLTEMAEAFIQLLPQLAVAGVVLVLTWLVAKLTNRVVSWLFSRTSIRRSLIDLFETLASIAVWLVGILVSITIVFPSITPANLLAALGLGSIAIGLAFKDIFENFLAGMMILSRRPMRIGDFIECDGVEGTVERITMRDTYLRRTDQQLVMVPNSMIYKNPVYVLTDREKRRFEIVCGVAYGENIGEARDVIKDALQELEHIDYNRAPEVFAREFGSSSVDFTIRWWSGSRPIDMHRSRDQVVEAIKRALDKAGIEIPFPYRTLTFKEPLPVNMKGVSDDTSDERDPSSAH